MLSPLVRSLSVQSIRRGDGGFDPKRLDPFENFAGDGTVDPHATKADATQLGSFAERTTACVTLRMRFFTAVGYLQFFAAPRAAEETGKQRAALADRSALRIPTNSATDSDVMSATCSDFMSAGHSD